MNVAQSAVGLTPAQAAMADLIEREFVAAGYSPTVAAAAIVNAYAESALNPYATGDRGKSVGLFQLHEKGAGHGMSVADRQNPIINIRTLIAREKNALSKVVGASIPELAAKFSTYVERPANRTASEAYRGALALRLFPFGIREAPAALVSVPAKPATSIKPVLWGAVALALGGIALAALLRARSRAKSAS